MNAQTLDRSGYPMHLWRLLPRRTWGLPLLLLALLVPACASTTAVDRDPGVAPLGPCRADLVMNDLLGRYPGVRVYRAGSGLQVRVRQSLEEPLYVLDGQPLAPGSPGILSAVNPCDIASIRVLSDPADLTFYGLRGANGVILITTKRP